jgi:uncharacterized iron-regulated membrane protein
VEAVGEPLAFDVLRAKFETAYPDAAVTGGDITVTEETPYYSLMLWVEAKDEAKPIPFTEGFINQYTGEVLGTRYWGAIQFDGAHFMPMIYRMHYSLLVQEWDGWGFWFLGILVLLWTVDHFVAFYVSIPRAGPFWKAMTIKFRGSAYRINFDFHRAGGIALLIVTLAIAITGAGWNSTFFGTNVIHAAIDGVSTSKAYPLDDLPELAEPPATPKVSSGEALRIFKDEIAKAGYGNSAYEAGVWYEKTKGAYSGWAKVNWMGTDYFEAAIDATTGEVKGTLSPADYTWGNTLKNWIFPLHTGQFAGLGGRILVCFAGIMLCGFCATGFVIWLKKNRAARHSKKKAAPKAGRPASAEPSVQPAE